MPNEVICFHMVWYVMQLILCGSRGHSYTYFAEQWASWSNAIMCDIPCLQIWYYITPWVVMLLEALWREKANPYLEYAHISVKTNSGPSKMKGVQNRWLTPHGQWNAKKDFPHLRSRGPNEGTESNSVWLKGRVHWLGVGRSGPWDMTKLITKAVIYWLNGEGAERNHACHTKILALVSVAGGLGIQSCL